MSRADAIQLNDLASSSLPLVRDFGTAGKAGEKDVNRALEPEGLIAASDLGVDIRAFEVDLDRLSDKIDHIVHAPPPRDSGPSIRIGRPTTSKVNWLKVNKLCSNHIRSAVMDATDGADFGRFPLHPSRHIGANFVGAA